MVKDHSDSEKGNPLPPHSLLFPINSKGSFICTISHTTAFVTPVVEHWLKCYMDVKQKLYAAVKSYFVLFIINLRFNRTLPSAIWVVCFQILLAVR